jgi:glycerophosphoryl diester phosphodiesterase
MKNLLFIMLFLVTITSAATPAQAAPEKAILIHGHRGARAIKPENTLTAFRYALDNHIDVLEMDMNVTKDNVIVISHEPHINPEICLDERGKKITQAIAIHDLTLEEVKKYDCGTLKNPQFSTQTPSPKEKIPTLEEVFEMVENSKDPFAQKIEFNIETKIFPSQPELSPSPKDFVKLFYALLKKHKMQKRVILQSFDDRTLLEMKKLDPHVRTAQLTSDNHIDYVTVAKTSRADIISPDWHWILPDDVKRLHKIRVQVAPWTADTKESWQKLIDMKVDAIITDDPVGLKEYLQSLVPNKKSPDEAKESNKN